MAYWFHRNPLKATAAQTFDFKSAAQTGQAHKICQDLKQARVKLLELVANPSGDVGLLDSAATAYLSLLHGFLQSLDEKGGESKLRHSFRFRWTNTLKGNTPTEQFDAVFDALSMCVNIALWLTKHAAVLAAKEEPTMDEAKEVHRCLKRAAGMFSYVKANTARLIEVSDKGTDLDSRVLDAYINQSQAEAQEVAIARAIELKHSPTLIAGLAFETSHLFTVADSFLKSLDPKEAGKWQKYLQLKAAFYEAAAYSYSGENLLAQDKCGEAIKCLRESTSNYEKAKTLSREYASTKGPGTTARPEEHLFFRKLGQVVSRVLDKTERENGFIYHQKVPEKVPELEKKASYGLATAEEFTFPQGSPLWTADVYSAIDISKNVAPQKSGTAALKAEGDLPPVAEKEGDQTRKDPKTSSGCIVS